MNRVVVLWVIVVCLVGWFMWFGTSDVRHGPDHISLHSTVEPSLALEIRPASRFIFGCIMSLLVIGTGIWVTKAWHNQPPDW
jgi:hypothetical protein